MKRILVIISLLNIMLTYSACKSLQGSNDKPARESQPEPAPQSNFDWRAAMLRGVPDDVGPVTSDEVAEAGEEGAPTARNEEDEEVEEEAPPAPSGKTRELIFFTEGGAWLSEISMKKLDAMAIGQNSIINIYGYSDSRGSQSFNKWISEARAWAVHAYLHKKYPDNRYVVKAFGEKDPRFSNKLAWGRKLNRRVFVFIKEP